MKVHGLQLNNGGLQHIKNRKSVKASETSQRKGDSVVISKSVKGGNLNITAPAAASIEFPPRIDRVRRVEQLIADGTYNNPEYIEATAEKVVDSPALKDTVSYVSTDRPENDTARAESVGKAQKQIRQNYFDNEKVMEIIAGRLIDVLGL